MSHTQPARPPASSRLGTVFSVAMLLPGPPRGRFHILESRLLHLLWGSSPGASQHAALALLQWDPLETAVAEYQWKEGAKKERKTQGRVAGRGCAEPLA